MSKKSSQDEFPRCLKFLRNSSDNTVKSYFLAIGKYERFHGESMEYLVREALDEQSKQVPPHLLKVIERIEDFQESLIEQGLVHGTISLYVGRIESIYRKNRVVLPYIEPLNPKRTKRNPVIEFSDVLTKDELRRILPLMRLPLRARAMTMIQGGLSNEECEHLTTRAFIDELHKYHQCDNDIDALEWLADEDNPVIWVTKLIRVKTGKPYYALIGAEAVNMIASAKLYEKDLVKNDGEIPPKLLDTNKISLNNITRRLNEKLHLGKAGGECKLKPHALRRFHATYINGSALSYEEHSLISNAEIDEMQGRGKTGVQDTYIKTNPLRQKTLYAKVMNNVSLWHEYEYQIIDDDVMVFVVDPSGENRKLRKEVEVMKKQLQQKKEASEKVQQLRKDLGEDTFKELIGEILNAS